MKYFIKGNYYFDIDHLNQFRITGPGNHLFLGWSIPSEVEVNVEGYEMRDDSLYIELMFNSAYLSTAVPLVSDIRTIRSYTEQKTPRLTYQELVQQNISDVLPDKVELRIVEGKPELEVSNTYYDDEGILRKYGCVLSFPRDSEVSYNDQRLTVSSAKDLACQITLISNISTQILTNQVFKQDDIYNQITDEAVKDFYFQSTEQVEHLITTEKTSSFEYGTIFPRDWIESADLGRADFTQSTIDYMYEQSMKHISEKGEGWHEDIIGRLKSKVSDESQHIDRKMIDIEPRYIMGFYNLSKKFLTEEKNREKLYLVSQYLLKNAEEQDLITFKKVADNPNQYHFVGNWRDSYLAFPRQKSPLAPYDVNCVFYPISLKIIKRYHEYFYVDDVRRLNELIEKWDQQKTKFRMYHPNGIIGYALALHGSKNKQVTTPHLDESYDLYYGSPSLEEVVSFTKKLVDPEYFYTPVGPMLVASDDEDFSTKEYHGKVIWPKQAAYAVAGLAKQYRRGQREYWPWQVMNLMREALMKTCHACFRGWHELGAVPELYYYDEKEDKAKFYTDQADYEGQMSLIQLWSAVGCRRIIREYVTLINEL